MVKFLNSPRTCRLAATFYSHALAVIFFTEKRNARTRASLLKAWPVLELSHLLHEGVGLEKDKMFSTFRLNSHPVESNNRRVVQQVSSREQRIAECGYNFIDI